MPATPRISISLEVPADLQTVYGNLARISHSPADIVIDIAHAMPGESKAVPLRADPVPAVTPAPKVGEGLLGI